jgi:hypothetical protein
VPQCSTAISVAVDNRRFRPFVIAIRQGWRVVRFEVGAVLGRHQQDVELVERVALHRVIGVEIVVLKMSR